MSRSSSRLPRNGLSHVFGDTSTPLINLTIPQVLAQTVATHGKALAAVFPKQAIRWTYLEFAAEIDRLAAGLISLGLSKGDRVGILSPNRAEWLLTQFATARIGAVLVCINPAYRVAELEYALNAVECRALITAQRFRSSDYIHMLNQLAPDLDSSTPGLLNTTRLPHLRAVIAMGDATPDGMISFDALCDNGEATTDDLDQISASLDPDDIINIQFTSGTTGAPKGASLTHRNITNNAAFVTATMAFTAQDRLCIPVPFYHCFGMVMGTLGCVTKGAAMIIPGEGFDPLDTLRAVSDEGCTALYGVPTMFLAMLESPDFAQFDLRTLRTGIMAGAPCPIEVMRRVQSYMHMSGVTIAYGMTETSPVSFQSNLDDPIAKRVSTVGRIHPHVECRIVDEAGAIVPVGTQGELLTRGYSVMKGYWGDAIKTSGSINAEGWMKTGDLAVFDAEGYCTITGRLKDMICRGGENIYPKEIEDFLFTHPMIEQAEVFGIPDAHYGEVTCAWIIPVRGARLDPETVRQYCKDNIAHYKLPTHIRIVDALPMTVTGKPQKFLMRKAMLAELTPSPQSGDTQ